MNPQAFFEGSDRLFMRGAADRDRIAAFVRETYPDVKFVSWREFGSTHGLNEKEILASLPQRFKELGVDAAISSMAC